MIDGPEYSRCIHYHPEKHNPTKSNICPWFIRHHATFTATGNQSRECPHDPHQQQNQTIPPPFNYISTILWWIPNAGIDLGAKEAWMAHKSCDGSQTPTVHHPSFPICEPRFSNNLLSLQEICHNILRFILDSKLIEWDWWSACTYRGNLKLEFENVVEEVSSNNMVLI